MCTLGLHVEHIRELHRDKPVSYTQDFISSNTQTASEKAVLEKTAHFYLHVFIIGLSKSLISQVKVILIYLIQGLGVDPQFILYLKEAISALFLLRQLLSDWLTHKQKI